MTDIETKLSNIVNNWRQQGISANDPDLIDIEVRLQRFENILTPNPDRFVALPIQYHEIWKHYKKHSSTFWVFEELDLSKDPDHWNHKLNDSERYFITHILGFFASFDGIVNENLTGRFMNEVQIPEARSFYGFQVMIENVHSEVYSNLIDCYISDPIEKDKVLHASKNFPSVAKMSDWALKWANSSNPFNQRILAYTCVEALFFSGPFCSIYWLKKRGLMPGLTHSNELISRDEGLHMDFGVLIHHLLKYPASNQTVRDIITDSVDLCREFICESLPCALIGMNSGEMSQYIEYIADRLMIKLTGETIYNVGNPFVGWMEMISIDAKTNFFEKKVSEYVKSGTNFDLLKSNGYQTTDNTNHTTNVFEDF